MEIKETLQKNIEELRKNSVYQTISPSAQATLEFTFKEAHHTLIQAVWDEVEEMILKVEEKNHWTVDSMKIAKLSGDAKCYNQALKHIQTYLESLLDNK